MTIMRTTRTRVLALIAASLTLALPRLTWAQSTPAQTPGFDPATGQDTRVFPPHVLADFQHMKLDILIPDMNTPKFSATETLTLSAIGEPLTELALDARALVVSSVAVNGSPAKFRLEHDKLRITFDPVLPVGRMAEVVMNYSVDDPPLGLIWAPESPAWPGRPAQLHTQGQPQTNSYWFPCHDFPNVRLTTEIVATVPAGYSVCSNGRLVSHDNIIRSVETPSGSQMLPFETYHWLQDKPHAPYLVSLVVGKFDIVDVGTKALSMPVYVAPGRGKDVPATFGHTKGMIDCFSTLLDEPYPWDKYAQISVYNFGSGGMENTSATTLHGNVVVGADDHEDFDQDGLISHELAHQWFGDLLTCKSWEYVWLNEGFATYMSALWFEHRDGSEGYERYIRSEFDGVIAGDTGSAPEAVGMASNAYSQPWEPFRRPANPYSKGSSVLHMLRMSLGDDVFFKCLRNYVDCNRLMLVENLSLSGEIEEVSGRSMDHFFEQWTRRPNIPRLQADVAFDAGASTLKVSIEQTQKIDGDNPAFEFTLPVLIQPADGSAPVTREIEVSGKSTSAEWPFAAPPLFVVIDPEMHVLAELKIKQNAKAWLAQLVKGPTLNARVQAARALAVDDSPLSAEALRRLVSDKAQSTFLRTEAVRALGRRHAEADLRSLLTSTIDAWEVREALVGAVADMALAPEKKDNTDLRQDIAEKIGVIAEKDRSTKVRAASLRAIGRLHAIDQAPIIRRALKKESQGDEIRLAAIDAAADLALPWAFDELTHYASPGTDSRTRPTAIAGLARMNGADKEKVYAFITPLLDDRELKSRLAAADALVALADPRGVQVFESHAANAKSEEIAAMCRHWKSQLESRLAPAGK